MSKQSKDFIDANFEKFLQYYSVKVYYNNDQKQLTRILASVLPIKICREVTFKKIDPPSSYKLFQVADIITTLELTNEKINRNLVSRYEKIFFKTIPQFKHDYYGKISLKKIYHFIDTWNSIKKILICILMELYLVYSFKAMREALLN